MKSIRTLVEAHLTTGFTGIAFSTEPDTFEGLSKDKFPHAIVVFIEDEPERLDFKQERRRVVGEIHVAIVTTAGDTAEAARESMDLQLEGVRDAIFADPYLTASVDDVRVAKAETISGVEDSIVYGEIEIIAEEVY